IQSHAGNSGFTAAKARAASWETPASSTRSAWSSRSALTTTWRCPFRSITFLLDSGSRGGSRATSALRLRHCRRYQSGLRGHPYPERSQCGEQRQR
ncbi:MAG: hypothetical protein JSS86_15095, partial [Cyanobacteria bacterium SZAS LIN-2]|nr:hypothetical protein [Cyanobacteria bacterium SZAS LIN-2]